MLVSTRGRYALRVMLELARHDAHALVPLSVLAERQGISEKYLESIAALLVRGGLVEGQRGKGGGYRLRQAPQDCSVGAVLRLTEGSLAPVSCLDGEENACPRANACETRPLWEELDSLITRYLDGVTLSDLLQGTNNAVQA